MGSEDQSREEGSGAPRPSALRRVVTEELRLSGVASELWVLVLWIWSSGRASPTGPGSCMIPHLILWVSEATKRRGGRRAFSNDFVQNVKRSSETKMTNKFHVDV